PARGLRGGRLHPPAVQGHLAGAPVLRVRGQARVRFERAEHVPRAARRDRGRHAVRAGSEEPQGDRGRHRAEELPQPAGGGARAGADRRVPGRPRQHEERARSHRLRPVPVPLDGDLDPHADEALGLPQDRRDVQEGGRGGVPGERVSRHPEGARLQGAGHGLGQARVRARQDEGLRSRPAGRLSQVVRDPEGVMRRDRLRVALYTIRDSAQAAVLVIVMSSLWPTLANTAFGVASIKRDYLNVAAILQLSWPRRLVTVILPAAAPAIVAGLRISVGSAWVAIVAAEMLIGGTGIGYFVWNEWNNLALTSVIFAILAIGVIGVLLDDGLGPLSRRLAYTE